MGYGDPVKQGGADSASTGGILLAVGTDKRERQKANRQKKMEEQHRAEKQGNIRSRVILFATIAALLLGALYLVSVVGGDDDPADETATAQFADGSDDAGEAEAPPEDDAEPDAEAAPEDDTDADAEVAVGPDAPDCPPVDGAAERTTEFAAAPPMCIDPAKSYSALVSTTMGDFTIELDAERAPTTVNSFVFLARNKFYDGVDFHRIIPGFVIQGGDAVGNPPGTGGPGYQIDDELPEAGDYELGSLAMANSGPDTSGSQFFVITGPQGEALPPLYSLFGKVTDGLDVPLAIQDVETDPGDAPVEPVTIESVTITES